MPVSEAKRRANAKYDKANVKQIGLRFAPPEHDLYEWAKSRDNVNGYIKGLIRSDMERGQMQ